MGVRIFGQKNRSVEPLGQGTFDREKMRPYLLNGLHFLIHLDFELKANALFSEC